LFTTTQDYTTDKRGDIGSIVREASMTAMITILRMYVDDKSGDRLVIDD